MRGEIGAELLLREIGLRDDHQPARVLIDTVDDAWALHAADAGEAVAAMGEQRVDEGAIGIAWGRVDDETGGLVEHEKLIVLIDDVQGHRLRLGPVGDRRGQSDDEALTAFDPHRGVVYRFAIQAHLTGFDQLLEPAAREGGEMCRQDAIEPLARFALPRR